MVARDHGTGGLGAAKDAGFLGLLQHTISGRERIIAAVAFERAERYYHAVSRLSLLSSQYGSHSLVLSYVLANQ